MYFYTDKILCGITDFRLHRYVSIINKQQWHHHQLLILISGKPSLYMKKRRIIQIHDKRKHLQGKVNNSQMARDLDMPTIKTILANREKIMEVFESGKCVGGIKKLWVSDVGEVNKCVLMWFRQQLSNHVPVDRGLLKMKAMDFGQQLQIEVDFSASNIFALNTCRLSTLSIIRDDNLQASCK